MEAHMRKIPKQKMAKAVDGIHKALTKELGDDLWMQTMALELILKAMKDQTAIEKIFVPSKTTGKDHLDHKINHVRKIVEGMNTSTVNIILFRNEDDVWMQYHMGLFLKKPTFIIALEEEKHEVAPRIKIGGIVKDVIFVKDFGSEETREKIMESLKKFEDQF